MKKVTIRLSAREWTLAAITGFVALFWPFLNHYLLPAYDSFETRRLQVESQLAEYTKLRRFINLREEVETQFAKVASQAEQENTDQITMSNFLRYLETRARYPAMTLINMKPHPVTEESGYKLYAVRMSLSARLHEILKFVSDITDGERVIAVDGFTLRGVQGGNVVECTLSVWMVRLPAARAGSSMRRTPVASRRETTYGN